ncbi:hypothetical protein GOV06_05470 [Candidatus Woesearchaeota archaeon]|nr:hypothetical protein [Candidatus Woesearchaeota archaeon]
MAMSKRGFFFTVDALLAASILLGGLLLLSSHYINTQPTAHLNYLSQDIINSLDVIKISDLNNSYVNELIANSNITDLNNSILRQVGEFWAAGNYDVAEAFMGNITGDIIPSRYGFGIWISQDLIYQRDSPPPSSRSAAKKLISGIEKNKPIDGYMSKARANTFTTVGTEIISFSPEGSGWKGSITIPSDAVIDKYFELPYGMNTLNATFFISVHIQSGGPDWELININNGSCIITKDELNFGTGDGVFDKKNVLGCFQSGVNHVRLRLRNLGYNAHIHPGMLIKIDYNLNGSIPTYGSDFSKRYYLDNVISYEGSSKESGVWQTVPFFIPEDAININVSAHIVGKNIIDYYKTGRFVSWSGWKNKRDYDYMMFINNDVPFDVDDHPSENPIYDYSSSQLEGEIITGTNVISIYFNNYGDIAWGGGMPQIYSDVINDPTNSSYIDVDYSLSSPPAPYASIKVVQLQEFGGEADWEKEISFSFPQYAASMGNVFLHLVQQYSYLVDVEADFYTPPLNTVFSSPSARAVPTTIYIPKNVLDLSPTANNYVRVTDRNRNDILPDTAVEYNFYVPSFVSYGEVFAIQQEAENDAHARLNQTLGEFVSSDNIVIESSEMRGVPTLWGPAIMEVRVWH